MLSKFSLRERRIELSPIQSIPKVLAVSLVSYPFRATPLAVALFALVLTGCGSGGGTDNPKTVTAPPIPVLTTVTVTFGSATIRVGQATDAFAAGLDQNGAAMGIGTVTWSTGSPSIATVGPTGAVSSVAIGQVSIVATVGTRTGSALLTIIPVPVASVSIAPPSVNLVIGTTQQLTATTLDSVGNALTGRVVTWATSDSTKARVSTSGLATAVAAGTATITATSEGKTGTSVFTLALPPVATVAVAPLAASVAFGATQALTATLKDAGGNVLTGRTVTWSSSNTSVATVSSTGVVTGVAQGTATVTAESDGRSGASAVTITLPTPVSTVSRVDITPSSLTLNVAQSSVVNASVRDASGNVIAGKSVIWATSNSSIVSGTVNGNSATLLGVGTGNAVVTATVDGVSASLPVTVTAAAVASVVITPSVTTIAVGATVTMTATLLDARGSVLTGRALAWSADGLWVVGGTTSGYTVGVTGYAVGTAVIFATSGAIVATAIVNVISAGPRGPVTMTCAGLAGAHVKSYYGEFLGRLTNPSDYYSILNSSGPHGSTSSSVSIYNPFSVYGNTSSSLSAYNPLTVVGAPRLYVDDVQVGNVSVASYYRNRISPDNLGSCSFP